jgi:hypothetical protein
MEKELLVAKDFENLHSIDLRERSRVRVPYKRRTPKKGILKKRSVFHEPQTPKKGMNLLNFGFLSPRKLQ